MTTTNTDQERWREEFEAHFNSHFERHIDGEYKDDITHRLWMGYLAARKHAKVVIEKRRSHMLEQLELKNGEIDSLESDLADLDKTFIDQDKEIRKCLGYITELGEEIQSLKVENEKLKHNFNIEDHACATGDCPHEKQSECDETLKSYKYQDQIQSLKQLLSEAMPWIESQIKHPSDNSVLDEWVSKWRAMK